MRILHQAKNQKLKTFDEFKNDYPHLRDWGSNESYDDNDKLFRKIEKESGDWYHEEFVSEALKKQYEKYEKYRDLAYREAADDFLDEYTENSKKYKDAKADVDQYAKEFVENYKKENASALNKYLGIGIKNLNKEANNALYNDSEYVKKDEKRRNTMREEINNVKMTETYKKLKMEDNEFKEKYAPLAKKAMEDALGVVLNDLGYKDTPESREYIRDLVFYD